MEMLLQGVGVVGACLILLAYLLLQRQVFTGRSPVYLWMNFVGGSLLTFIAMIDQRLGFILVEGAWALISLYGLLRLSVRSKRTPG